MVRFLDILAVVTLTASVQAVTFKEMEKLCKKPSDKNRCVAMLDTPRLDDVGAPLGYRPLILDSQCDAIGHGWYTNSVPSTVKTKEHLGADVTFENASRQYTTLKFKGKEYGRGEFECDDGKETGEVICQASFPCK
ncbi:hypothetical protein KEM56_006390 [Ascosphaera pollenicola]|nr:hypothetical protein KEM56_006390 [Ascosphaera pollenicola]